MLLKRKILIAFYEQTQIFNRIHENIRNKSLDKQPTKEIDDGKKIQNKKQDRTQQIQSLYEHNIYYLFLCVLLMFTYQVPKSVFLLMWKIALYFQIKG